MPDEETCNKFDQSWGFSLVAKNKDLFYFIFKSNGKWRFLNLCPLIIYPVNEYS